MNTNRLHVFAQEDRVKIECIFQALLCFVLISFYTRIVLFSQGIVMGWWMSRKFNCFILSLGGVGHIELGIVSLF